MRGAPFQVRVGGYAGTGKTTLLAHLRREIKKSFPKLYVAFVTYTGKASSVLKMKLEENNVLMPSDYVGTIHGLIYKPKVKWDRKLKTYVVVDWKLRDEDEMLYDIIIIDEGSMVSKDIWVDLQKMKRPIIVMGDHGQLPPIGDQFSLMTNTHFRLNNIHRQALNSPIIALSKFVRDNGYIPYNRIFSKDVFKLAWNHPKCKKIWDHKVTFDENLIVLCAFNATRNELNKKIRKKLGHKDENLPLPGERIVCLQNDHQRGIMNGQIANLLWIMPESYDLYRMTIDVDGYTDPLECTVSSKCFGEVTYTMYDKTKAWKKQYQYAIDKGIAPINYFDFGYAMSVHKSQGSEWDKVILFEQRTKHWDDEMYARWLYTGITRARDKLFIISDYWG
jgi:exodeoxyribonuclease-5